MKKENRRRLIVLFILFVFMGSSISYAVLFFIPTEENVNWRARLDIYIDGNLQTIPPGIGENTTLYTLAADNIIYKVGSKNLTLGDFFDIWGEPFSSSCILEYCKNSTHELIMHVNNVKNYDFNNYILQNNDWIEIDYTTI